ncbi:MAG: lipid II flippase MurJ [Acidimicrobiales bacterium]
MSEPARRDGRDEAVAAPSGSRRALRRSTIVVTALNLLSRATGFIRVLATASALGVTVLGDTYQRSNQVSNLLFELLAGGMLFSVLVPGFVDLLTAGDRASARRLAAVLSGRGLAAMAVLVAVVMAFSQPLMALLSAGADPATRDAQAELGAFLLWFVAPQLLFYLVGAIASGLLQSDQRFAAAAFAPVCNNVVVTASMVAFAIVHDPARGLALTTGEKVLLGAGALAGTVAMTVVPLVAVRRAGLGFGLGWRTDGLALREMAERGAWGRATSASTRCSSWPPSSSRAASRAGSSPTRRPSRSSSCPTPCWRTRSSPPSTPTSRARAPPVGTTSSPMTSVDRCGPSAPWCCLPPGSGRWWPSRCWPTSTWARSPRRAPASWRWCSPPTSPASPGTRASSCSRGPATPSAMPGRPPSSTRSPPPGPSSRWPWPRSCSTEPRLLVSFGLINAVGTTGGSIALHRHVVHRMGVAVPVAGSIARSTAITVTSCAAAAVLALAIGWDSRTDAVLAAVTCVTGGASRRSPPTTCSAATSRC